jgi:hypothetical protein
MTLRTVPLLCSFLAGNVRLLLSVNIVAHLEYKKALKRKIICSCRAEQIIGDDHEMT